MKFRPIVKKFTSYTVHCDECTSKEGPAKGFGGHMGTWCSKEAAEKCAADHLKNWGPRHKCTITPKKERIVS